MLYNNIWQYIRLTLRNVSNHVLRHELQVLCSPVINTLRPRQNRRHFADDIFKCIFLNKNVWIPIKISLKFVPQGPINSIPALVQIMAWRRPGDKPLSGPMIVRLPTHICVTRPQWVKFPINSQAIIWQWTCDNISFGNDLAKKLAASHYINHWWQWTLMHICVNQCWVSYQGLKPQKQT